MMMMSWYFKGHPPLHPLHSSETPDINPEIPDIKTRVSRPQAGVSEPLKPRQHQSSIPHPRVHYIIQKDHPVDNILGSISKGVTTRSRLATFCEHTSLFLPWNLLRWRKHWMIRIGWWLCKKNWTTSLGMKSGPVCSRSEAWINSYFACLCYSQWF